MATDFSSDALWSRLSAFIAENTGLNFPFERRAELQRALACAAAELGFADAVACADWLLSAAVTKKHLHAVAKHLTVGETYFFREPDTFEALATHILPRLISQRRGRDQHLRLWSTACSTGEEPYSLAILLQQLLPDWREWQLTILATDINERALEKATAGVYSEWSFRKSPPGFKDSYFSRTDHNQFAIMPEIKKLVHFAHLNLSQDFYPSLVSETTTMDLIFCRNVLMYFTLPHMRKLVDKLHDALDDDGWLAVSPCECSQTLFGDFVSVNFAGTTLYQKRIGRSVAVPWMPPPLSGPVGASLEPLVPPLWAPMNYTAAIEASDSSDEAASLPTPQPDNSHVPGTSPSSPVSNGASSLSLAAQSFADQGKLNDALAFTERWAATDKLNSAAHYLNAMVLQERGEREHMRRSLNRALYLQPDFALAHFALGNLERADAHETQASKHFENALRLLRSQMPDEPLPHADGLTAGRLSEIISSLLFRPQRAVKTR